MWLPSIPERVERALSHLRVSYLKQHVDAFETTLPQQARTLTIRGSDTERGLPTTEATCPECDHDEAYWDIKQLRSSDEAPTEIYICTNCAHTWRRD